MTKHTHAPDVFVLYYFVVFSPNIKEIVLHMNIWKREKKIYIAAFHEASSSSKTEGKEFKIQNVYSLYTWIQY